jgi:hypothetical protein
MYYNQMIEVKTATSDKDKWTVKWTLDKPNGMEIGNGIGIDSIDNGIFPKYKKYLIIIIICIEFHSNGPSQEAKFTGDTHKNI